MPGVYRVDVTWQDIRAAHIDGQHTSRNPLAIAIERELGISVVITDQRIHLYNKSRQWDEVRPLSEDAQHYMHSVRFGRAAAKTVYF